MRQHRPRRVQWRIGAPLRDDCTDLMCRALRVACAFRVFRLPVAYKRPMLNTLVRAKIKHYRVLVIPRFLHHVDWTGRSFNGHSPADFVAAECRYKLGFKRVDGDFGIIDALRAKPWT